VVGPTAVRVQPEAAVFLADHPFVLLIRDGRTDTILFWGRIVDPSR
jgi:serine protease inhibitor